MRKYSVETARYNLFFEANLKTISVHAQAKGTKGRQLCMAIPTTRENLVAIQLIQPTPEMDELLTAQMGTGKSTKAREEIARLWAVTI